MMNQPTLEKMAAMKMSAMVEAFEQQRASRSYGKLSFEERLGMLIDAEYAAREQRKLTRRLQRARLRQPSSCIEDIDFKTPRGIDKSVILRLAECDWIRSAQNVIITGATGVGKTYLTCALANRACRMGFSAFYIRIPRLFQELAIARGDGSYPRIMKKLTKAKVLILDDLGLAPMTAQERRDLLEVIEDRHGLCSTIVATQLPIESWHDNIRDPTIADAILDRLIHNAHKINLKGESMRKLRSKSSKTRKEENDIEKTD